MFDSEMNIKACVTSINRSVYPQLKNLRAIKPVLDMEAANTAAHAFISSCLGTGNSILYGTAQDQLQRIQRTQNTVCRIILIQDNTNISPQSFINLVSHTGADLAYGVV